MPLPSPRLSMSRVTVRILALLTCVHATSALAQEEHPGASGIADHGQRGIHRSWDAVTYPEGSVVLSTGFEFFHYGDFPAQGGDHQRFATRQVVFGVPIEGLEPYSHLATKKLVIHYIFLDILQLHDVLPLLHLILLLLL